MQSYDVSDCVWMPKLRVLVLLDLQLKYSSGLIDNGLSVKGKTTTREFFHSGRYNGAIDIASKKWHLIARQLKCSSWYMYDPGTDIVLFWLMNDDIRGSALTKKDFKDIYKQLIKSGAI